MERFGIYINGVHSEAQETPQRQASVNEGVYSLMASDQPIEKQCMKAKSKSIDEVFDIVADSYVQAGFDVYLANPITLVTSNWKSYLEFVLRICRDDSCMIAYSATSREACLGMAKSRAAYRKK